MSTPSTSINHATMQGMNTALILETLRHHAPISRAGIAQTVGLNKATVSTIVRLLLDNGFVREMGTDSTSDVGRPSVQLELNPDAGFLISAEIGVGFISIIATNFHLEVVARRYEHTHELQTQEAVLDFAITLLKEMVEQLRSFELPIFGMTMCVPGLVDHDSGELLFAPNLGWRNVPIRRLLAFEFDLPIYVSNEASMAAFGESYLDSANDMQYLLYISSGIGLGGGIVLDGRLMTGSSGFAGEVGHMTIDPGGYQCNCGNVGCWETVGTERAVFRIVKQRIAAGNTSLLWELSDGKLGTLTVEMVRQAARAGDAVARDALAETGRWIGIGISNLINVVNPQRVVFGGTLSIAHEFILPAMKKEINQRALQWSQDHLEVVIARYEADGAIVGGAAKLHANVISHPMDWINKP